jgi:uncharacterized repeat protein (TIGR01451 family)
MSEGLRMPKRLRLLVGGFAAALVFAAPSAAAAATTSPVPSLTPKETARLWTRLVQQRRPYAAAADCQQLRAVFYTATDWLRLTTRLAANPSPCAQYYISVPPLAADKTELRTDQAWRIRALGPSFHALAEINVTGWTAWVTTTGNSWYAAGVEARRRMATAGYDVAAGDTWALNELSSAVRQGVGNARANMRAFLNGLHDGDGVLPTAKGTVFIAGIGQATGDLSVYQARLQDWYEDPGFWSDLSLYASDWSQEVYGDVRNYAVAGMTRDARRDALNEYLQHQTALVGVAPGSAAAARTFLTAAYSPLANAAWRYDASFGWTDVPVELMQDYVSAQTYAARSAANGRFGFAWSPRNLAGIPSGDFNAQTDALLVRLAAAISDSSQEPTAACGATWCTGTLEGAAATTAWSTFAAWKPSGLAITSNPQTLSPGTPSAPITVELRTSGGTPYTAGIPVSLQLASSSPTGEFSSSSGGPWAATLASSIASGASTASVYFRDPSTGSGSITATATGKTAATQAFTIAPPPETTPPPPAPAAVAGQGPDLTVQTSASPSTAVVGATVTYVISVRNVGGPASRAFVAVQLPPQVNYAGSDTDRGPGCTGTTTLTCDLDFLAGDLVATARIRAVIREPGTLSLTATSSAQPADVQPANDFATVVMVVRAPAAQSALRLAGATPPVVTRRSGTATLSLRFRVSSGARLQARVTPLRSTSSITLLKGTVFAGARSTAIRPIAKATVARAGTFDLRARLHAASLVRGRSYLIRITATSPAGRQRTLTIRVRA